MNTIFFSKLSESIIESIRKEVRSKPFNKCTIEEIEMFAQNVKNNVGYNFYQLMEEYKKYVIAINKQ